MAEANRQGMIRNENINETQRERMKCLIVIPHIFNPIEGSQYSSQTERKRETKIKALKKATIYNLHKHSQDHWIHASLGNKQKIVTRKLVNANRIDITIKIYTNINATLVNSLPANPKIEIVNIENCKYIDIPSLASRRLLEEYKDYDILGYMEDDILIEDPEFFQKVKYLNNVMPDEYAILPHRCEHIAGKGDVILSGDPDGGRPDLFWDTGETIYINWPTGRKKLYRATNPHSGCFFLSKSRALKVLKHWESRHWREPFQLCGPLEQAASGRLIEVLKLMKPSPENYEFLMVRHLDDLWKRHEFEKSS